MKLSNLRLLLIWFTLPVQAFMSHSTLGAPTGVAVVTEIVGTATYVSSASGSAAPLVPFQQLTSDDRVELPPESATTFVFFSGSRERWEGPVKLHISENSSRSLDESATEPLREDFSDDVQDELQLLPEIMGNSRAAGTIVLAPNPADMPKEPDCSNWQPLDLTGSEQDHLKAVRGNYEAMRDRVPAGDHSPELYLLSALIRYDQLEQAIDLIESLQGKHPENGMLERVMEWALHCKPHLQP